MLASIVSSLPLIGRAPKLDTCVVCGRAVTEGDARMRLAGGGYVHRGCSTYRMRHRDRIRRRARSVP
jgi:hypothetical protein